MLGFHKTSGLLAPPTSHFNNYKSITVHLRCENQTSSECNGHKTYCISTTMKQMGGISPEGGRDWTVEPEGCRRAI